MKKSKKILLITAAVLLLLGAVSVMLLKHHAEEKTKVPVPQQPKKSTITDVTMLVRSTSVILKDLHDNYVREADRIVNKFQYSSIKKDPSGKDAKKLVADVKELISDTRKNFLGIIQEFSKNMQALNLSEKDRRFLEKEALPAASILHEKMLARWDLELTVLHLNETLLEQLINKEPDWLLDENGRILFKCEEDGDEFKELLSKIHEEYKKQNQIRSDSQQLLNDLIRRLQNYQKIQKMEQKPAAPPVQKVK